MSMTKCRECGEPVSNEAKACPHCGAGVEKPTSATAKAIVVLIGTAIFGSMIFGNKTGSVAPPETPEQIAQKAAENTRYYSAIGLVHRIKKSLRDPDSLAFESLLINDDNTLLCTQYRARNGFGGMNGELLVITHKKTSQAAADWNKHCTKPMNDMLWVVKYAVAAPH